ncbi:hypothetical protein VM1G_01459 [Cytospora mali]|uniref:Uncharacterized protein n=1 Tax=Cytospora mali TaxID=578113 RepID=A0A194VSN0_CYTMA|nr:hypothetical protein VM1G_01459 [Valsa mali]
MPPSKLASGSQARPNAGQRQKRQRAPKQPKMSDEAWNTAVAAFRSVVDDEASDDRAIQQAWTTLRQNYGDRFNAKIIPQLGAQQNVQQEVQPFSLWAVDHLDEDVLERVLRVVFAKDLAGCDHLTLLKSTASLASTTMWHLILYFGVTVFSEHLLSHIRKRVRVFEKGPLNNDTSAFTDAYNKMLQAAALRHRMVLDSTTIPCPRSGRIFIKPDLSALASANPEFDKSSQRKAAAGTGNSLVQDQKKAATMSNSVFENNPNTNKPTSAGTTKTTDTAPRTGASPPRREDPLPGVLTGDDVSMPFIESPVRLRPRAPSAPALTRSQPDSHDQQDHSFPIPPKGQPVRRNPPRKARVGAQNAVPRMISSKPEETVDNEIKNEPPPPTRHDESIVEGHQTRELSTIYVRTEEPPRALSKRPIKEEAGEASTANSDRAKRANKTTSRSALLGKDQDWDDDTILHVLKQLAATSPGEWTVIDCMREDATSPPIQLEGDEGENGSLLVTLKMEDGQRRLVVVSLKPSYGVKRSFIRYYESARPTDVDAAVDYEPIARLESLLTHVLPGRDIEQEDWIIEHCVFPEPVSKKDDGLAICLGAMYAIGSRPFPEDLDWDFWRHLVLGGFFPDDVVTQLQVHRYREGLVQKLIRQGKISNGLSTNDNRGTSSDDVEYLGTAAVNPVERMEWREENAKKVIMAIHEGFKVFQTIQEHIDIGKASFKTQLDKNAYILKDLRCKLNMDELEVLLKIEQGEQTEEAFEMTTLQGATKEHTLCQDYLKGLEAVGESVQKALCGLTTWRQVVNEAAAEEDESLLMRSIE